MTHTRSEGRGAVIGYAESAPALLRVEFEEIVDAGQFSVRDRSFRGDPLQSRQRENLDCVDLRVLGPRKTVEEDFMNSHFRSRMDTGMIERYKREGMIAPIAALEPVEVTRYRAALDELAAFTGGRLDTIARQMHLHFPWAYELVQHPVVLDVLEDLMGPNILVHSSTLFAKPPHETRHVSWHQDAYHFKLDAPRMVTAWVALSESIPENGCVRVLIGSHGRALPHTELRSPDNLLPSGITVDLEIDESRVRDVVLRPGEVAFHHHNAVHSSGANRTDTMRVGLSIRYVPADTQQATPHHDVILARGRDFGHYSIMKQAPSGTIAQCIESQRRRQYTEEHKANIGM